MNEQKKLMIWKKNQQIWLSNNIQ